MVVRAWPEMDQTVHWKVHCLSGRLVRLVVMTELGKAEVACCCWLQVGLLVHL